MQGGALPNALASTLPGGGYCVSGEPNQNPSRFAICLSRFPKPNCFPENLTHLVTPRGTRKRTTCNMEPNPPPPLPWPLPAPSQYRMQYRSSSLVGSLGCGAAVSRKSHPLTHTIHTKEPQPHTAQWSPATINKRRNDNPKERRNSAQLAARFFFQRSTPPSRGWNSPSAIDQSLLRRPPQQPRLGCSCWGWSLSPCRPPWPRLLRMLPPAFSLSAS